MFDATIKIKIRHLPPFAENIQTPTLKGVSELYYWTERFVSSTKTLKRKIFYPKKWVELSQKYITDYLGENWQDEYYVWTSAGTGNYVGLTNKYNIYAGTQTKRLIMTNVKTRCKPTGKHVFQFDFLNDDFPELPQSADIINDPEKRKKLIDYKSAVCEHNENAISGTGNHKEETSITINLWKI